MVRVIKLYPEDIKALTRPSERVLEINDEIRSLATDLIATAQAQKDPQAAGLAAPQIGVMKRVVVVYILGQWTVMINPEFSPEPGVLSLSAVEGCLSLPSLVVGVTRPEAGATTYQDLANNTQVLRLEGFPARCVQHEIDHLDGILIIHPTRISSLRRRLALEKYAKARGLRLKK